MTNEQIDDFIATRVMGWRRLSPAVGYRNAWIEDHATPGESIHTDWHPATDLNQAAQAAEKFVSWRVHQRGLGHGYYALISTKYGAEDAESTIGPADALARAVVKAAGGEA